MNIKSCLFKRKKDMYKSRKKDMYKSRKDDISDMCKAERMISVAKSSKKQANNYIENNCVQESA